MACCIGLMLLASCKKDVQPTITFLQGEEYLTDNAEIYSGTEHMIGFAVTGEKLTNVEVRVMLNGELFFSSTLPLDEPDTYNATFPISISSDAAGTLAITGTVTDAKEHTASTSITVTCIERPNAKFVGRFEGDALITGTLNVIPNNMDPMEQEFQDEPISVQLNIESGENVNEVIAFVTINEQENPDQVNGIVEGNNVVFEAINVPFTMNYENNGMSIPVTLDMTYNITGTLNNGMLELEGECKGSGDFNLFIIAGTIEMEGTVGGSLTKTE